MEDEEDATDADMGGLTVPLPLRRKKAQILHHKLKKYPNRH